MTQHNNIPGEDPQARSISALEILAASLALRLTLAELECLYRELEEQANEKRRKAGEEPVQAGYRDAWEPVRNPA